MTIEEIKKNKKTPSGYYQGNTQLPTGKIKIVLIKIIDEENQIVELTATNLPNEPEWALQWSGFYKKECFSEEILKVFSWNPHSSN